MTALRAQHAEMQSVLGGAEPETAAPGFAAGGRAASATDAALAPFVRADRKVGRNEPCPCGSGKKYKHCHGVLVNAQ
jgi:preprotein translocase subunit SecA